MSLEAQNYICINCGRAVKTLFRKYSASVLKLTECEQCHSVADKYIECDIVIVIIDLVLLRKEAYRHILYNTEFKNFWKLSVILLLMEAYSDWALNSNKRYNKNEEKPMDLHDVDVELADFQFYVICFKVIIKTMCLVLVLYILTLIYCQVMRKHSRVTFFTVWKALTMSSFGIFLLLPSLIWDMSLQEFHFSIVALYTTFAQLLAYTVSINCPRLWSVVAIFSSYYCKSFILEFADILVQIIKYNFVI